MTIDLKTADQLVSGFHKTQAAAKTAHTRAADDFSAGKRNRLWGMLAEAYGVSLDLLAVPDVLGQLCFKRGVRPAGEGENPYGVPVKLLFRKRKAGTNRTEADQSAWKYGKCFRAAASLGWTRDNFVDELTAYNLTVVRDGKDKKLGGLVALEALDVQNHGDFEGKLARHEVAAAQIWLGKQAPLASFKAELTEEAPEATSYTLVSLVAQYNHESGMWDVRRVVHDQPEKAWALIAKDTLVDFKKARDERSMEVELARLEAEAPQDPAELLAALERHNREVALREASADLTTKLTSQRADKDEQSGQSEEAA